MHNILVIIKKQIRDTLKNKSILIQFILFPLMTIIMENAIHLDDMPECFFTKLFAVMYIGMAPFVTTASIIAEEKEKNTLRVLMMADVKPWQYLIGIGVYVQAICMVGACIMSTGLPTSDRGYFLLIMSIGFMISIIAGACVGIFSRNQMMATSLTMPFMIIFSFAPMLSMFNESIKKYSTVVFTQQIRILFDKMSFEGYSQTGMAILCASVLICVGLFFFAYQRKGLE